MSGSGGGRRHGVPVTERVPVFNTQRTGRLTHLEYNLIDMHIRSGVCDVVQMALLLNVELRLLERYWNRMRCSEIVSGVPSLFRVTSDGMDAFYEADGWLLDPENRPRRIVVRVPIGGGRTMSRRCWQHEADEVRQQLRVEAGLDGQQELAV